MAEKHKSNSSELRSNELRAFLREEFNQAWSHYRHIESERNKFLGFAFTLILGSTGFIIAIMKDFDPTSDSLWVIIGLSVFVNLIGIILVLLLGMILKSKYLCWHYIAVWQWVRTQIYGNKDEQIKAHVDLYKQENEIFKSKTFAHQHIIAILIWIFIAAIIMVQLASFVFLWWKLDLSMRIIAFTMSAILVCAICVYAIVYFRKKPKTEQSASPRFEE